VAAFLFDEVWQQGYRGSKRTVRRQLAAWRTAEPPPPAHVMLPGPWRLVWLLLRRPSDLDEEEQVLLKQMCEWSVEVVSARQLAQHFMRLVRERRGYELTTWAAEVQNTGPPELRGFSRNLRRDRDAVQAGLTEHWSSGCVEGHVNKLSRRDKCSDGLASTYCANVCCWQTELECSTVISSVDDSEQRRAAREHFKTHYRALYDEVLEILFQVDPIRVHGGR
jgi:hypothetical protein